VPVTATEVKGMDRVKRTQIQVRTILKDYHSMFSNVRDDRELVETFQSLFADHQTYWRHIRRHALPKKVLQEFHIKTWEDVMKKSRKLFPYQVKYAFQFLDTLGYIEKLALQELPTHSIDRLIIFSSKNRVAVILDETGKVASLFELDIFKKWGEWKSYLISKGANILEVPIDEEIRRTSLEIRKRSRSILRGSKL
jgi:hypothetical protein